MIFGLCFNAIEAGSNAPIPILFKTAGLNTTRIGLLFSWFSSFSETFNSENNWT